MKNMKRKKIETRILTILEYIHHPIAPKLKEHLDIFSVHELSQLLAFLETWEFNSIQQFFEEQIQEYKVIGQELKIKKSLSHFQNQKTEEKKERDKERDLEEEKLQKILDD